MIVGCSCESPWTKVAATIPFVGSFVTLFAVKSLASRTFPEQLHAAKERREYSLISAARCLVEAVACVALVALGLMSPFAGIIFAVAFVALSVWNFSNARALENNVRLWSSIRAY